MVERCTFGSIGDNRNKGRNDEERLSSSHVLITLQPWGLWVSHPLAACLAHSRRSTLFLKKAVKPGGVKEEEYCSKVSHLRVRFYPEGSQCFDVKVQAQSHFMCVHLNVMSHHCNEQAAQITNGLIILSSMEINLLSFCYYKKWYLIY